jgi:hypothetical protein
MADTTTKPRVSFAESLARRGHPVQPGPESLSPVPETAATPAPDPSVAANDEDQPVVVGGQRTRTYSGQQRVAERNGLSTLWVYDSESGVAYELDYEALHTRLWTPRHADVMILEFRSRHVGIEGARLPMLLALLAARRVSELSMAARPEFDPKTEGKAHLRRIVVRVPGYMRIRNGKLDAAPEWEDGEQDDARVEALAEANA